MIGRSICVGLAALVMMIWMAGGVGEAADADRRFNVRGLGTTACGQYLDIRSGRAVDSEPFAHWFTGFLSAYNWLQPDTFDISWEYQSHGLLIWLDYYCRGNPENRVIDGAMAFVHAVYDRRMRAES
jgi:hypothetical protein